MSAMNRRAEPSLSKPPAAADPREDLRGALLYTMPGRAIVIGLAIKLTVFLVGLAIGRVPAFFTVVDTVAGLAVAAGLVYFANQGGIDNLRDALHNTLVAGNFRGSDTSTRDDVGDGPNSPDSTKRESFTATSSPCANFTAASFLSSSYTRGSSFSAAW